MSFSIGKLAYWQCQRIFEGPSKVEPTHQRSAFHPDLLCPVFEALGDAVIRQQPIPSRIACLNGFRSPYTVVRTISEMIIEAFKRMTARRPRSHIRIKSLKCMPSGAHGNPTASIVRIGCVARLFAPLQHIPPNTKLPRLTFPRFRQVDSCRLTSKASTRRGIPGQQIVGTDPQRIAFNASTLPNGLFAPAGSHAIPYKRDDCQSVKTVAEKILRRGMQRYGRVILHVGVLPHRTLGCHALGW